MASPPKPATKASSPENGTASASGNEFPKLLADRTASPPAHNNANGSAPGSGFNQLRNEFLTMAWRVATTKKQAIAEVVEWASGGTFKYGDIGRLNEADATKLRAATQLITSAVQGQFADRNLRSAHANLPSFPPITAPRRSAGM